MADKQTSLHRAPTTKFAAASLFAHGIASEAMHWSESEIALYGCPVCPQVMAAVLTSAAHTACSWRRRRQKEHGSPYFEIRVMVPKAQQSSAR